MVDGKVQLVVIASVPVEPVRGEGEGGRGTLRPQLIPIAYNYTESAGKKGNEFITKATLNYSKIREVWLKGYK